MDLKQFGALAFSVTEMEMMFDLKTPERNLKILHAQAGASLFAASLNQKNSVTACDSLYQKSISEIKTNIAESIRIFEEDVHQHPYQYTNEQQARKLVESSKKNMALFLEDYVKQSESGEARYYYANLSALPFKDGQFELALVSHFLFTYSDSLSLEFHVQAIEELIRVANEVRIYPLVTEQSALSPHLGNVIAHLQKKGLNEEIRIVPFELQKKGNAMLRIWSNSCSLLNHTKSE